MNPVAGESENHCATEDTIQGTEIRVRLSLPGDQRRGLALGAECEQERTGDTDHHREGPRSCSMPASQSRAERTLYNHEAVTGLWMEQDLQGVPAISPTSAATF